MISIIIPTYNRPLLLCRAVQSALTACPHDGEVVVVDDRSHTAEAALQDKFTDARLRVLTNKGEKGAAGARNFGITQSIGSVVMFLDDDDTLISDYPARVLMTVRNSEASWGFSSQHVIRNDEKTTVPESDKKGYLFPKSTPLRQQIAAFSAGFWIKREVMLAVGEIAPEQINDEDTDLCCRLVAGGYRGWFEPSPGCIIFRGYQVDDGTAPQLTQVFDPNVASQCYARTFQRNERLFQNDPAARWFLLFRTLRACARNRSDVVARDVLRELPIGWFKVKGYVYWQIKRLGKSLGFK